MARWVGVIGGGGGSMELGGLGVEVCVFVCVCGGGGRVEGMIVFYGETWDFQSRQTWN